MPDRETEKEAAAPQPESVSQEASDGRAATDAQEAPRSEKAPGVPLGIKAYDRTARRSAYDLLPGPIKDARDRLEREFAAERNAQEDAERRKSQGTADEVSPEPKTDDGEITLHFAERFKRLTDRSQKDQESKMKGFFHSRSTSAYVVAALLFAVWMVYTHFYGTDETQMSFADLQSRVPMRIDSHTVLSRAERSADGVFLTVDKEKGAFEGMTDAEIAAAMDKIAVNAQSLCNNELFNRLVRSGTVLHVSLKSEDGQISRESTISQCPTTQETR